MFIDSNYNTHIILCCNYYINICILLNKIVKNTTYGKKFNDNNHKKLKKEKYLNLLFQKYGNIIKYFIKIRKISWKKL